MKYTLTNDKFEVVGKQYLQGVGGYDGTNPNTNNDVATVLPNMVEVTYSELVSLRNSSKLIPGQQYRITDYITTTTQENTLSAGHQFDVIVTADDEKTLNENARAIQHEGDSYFFNSNLAAWELKYCLDNDYTRFEWAQEIELSPVSKRKIIRVHDGNDDNCPYIYLRYPEGDENGEYAWVYDSYGDDLTIKEYISNGFEDYESEEYIYTTTENPSIGYSVDGYGSVIEVSSTAAPGKGVIYYMKDEWNNECPYDFKNIMFRVTSGQSEYNYYTFHNPYTSYKDDSINVDGGISTYGNVIKPYITSSSMHINMIRFGHGCHNNTFDYSCYNNTFGNNCSNNSFGNYCSNNSFDGSCNNNTFGSNCSNNSFGQGCSDNSLGYYCFHVRFGHYCSHNSLGANCDNITFGTSSTTKNYYRNIIIDNYNSYIYLNCTSRTNSYDYFQNVKIGSGVGRYFNGDRITISNSEINQEYETLYRAANSKTLKPDGTSF